MYRFILVLLITTSTACTVVPPPGRPSENADSSQSSQSFETVALQQYEKYRQTGAEADLIAAKKSIALAHNVQPDKLSVQALRYRMEMLEQMDSAFPDKRELERQYRNLHPLLRADLPPPSVVHYTQAQDAGASAHELLAILTAMIVDKPNSGGMWYELSRLYENEGLNWLALYAAKRAIELSSDEADYHFQSGYLLRVIAAQHCSYESKAYMQAALPYLLRANGLEEKAHYLNNIATVYLELGITPLGYDQAKKAFALDQASITARTFAQAAFLLGKTNEAIDIVDGVEVASGGPDVRMMKSIAQASSGQWREAVVNATEYVTARQQERPDSEYSKFYGPLYLAWLEALNSGGAVAPTWGQMSGITEWQISVLPVIQARLAQESEQSLVALATNACEKTEAYFFEAMTQWSRGDMAAAKRSLALMKQQGATLFDEYLLGEALLRSGIFDAAVTR